MGRPDGARSPVLRATYTLKPPSGTSMEGQLGLLDDESINRNKNVVETSLIRNPAARGKISMSERFDFTKMFRGDEKVRTLKAGDVLFREGEPGDLMYVVTSGDMGIMVRNHVLERTGPGGIVGELALVDNSPRSATVTAASDCEVIPVDRRGFAFMVQNTPFFALHVMGVLADRLRDMNARPLAD